jgi:predicted HTH transcriptional regulator
MNPGYIGLIESILKSKKLEDFIGVEESLEFEVKNSSPYDFSSPGDRYELAKDVSSLANSKGGYIIIGLKTDPLQERKSDIVSELDLIKKEDFNSAIYSGVIKDNIFPNIEKIDVGWVEDDSKTGFGIGYIYIPIQNDNKKYFITKNIIEDNEKIKNIVFGVSERKDGDSIPLNEDKIYKTLQSGKSSVSERLTSIEGSINKLFSLILKKDKNKKLNNFDKDIENKIKNIL